MYAINIPTLQKCMIKNGKYWLKHDYTSSMICAYVSVCFYFNLVWVSLFDEIIGNMS